jgi:hypothetical protein
MNEGTSTLIRQIDPRTFDEDLETFERETHQSAHGVREVVNQHRPEPMMAWPEAYSPVRDDARLSPQSNEQSPSPRQDNGYEEDYRMPTTMNADEMFEKHHAPNTPMSQEQHHSFVDLFRSISANKGASVEFASDPRPTPRSEPVDASFFEREELLAKIADLRMLGFDMPPNDQLRSMTTEDLRSIIRRRTKSNETHTTLNALCDVICAAAKWIQLGNSKLGGLISIPTYAQDVEDASKTPRFRLAIYQLVLKLNGKFSPGPLMEIGFVLFFPLIQGIILRIISHFSGGRLSANPNGLNSTMSMLTKPLSNLVRRDKNDGGGIDGIENYDDEEDEDDDDDEEEEAAAATVLPVQDPPTNTGLGGRIARPVLRRPGYIVAA